MVVLVECVTVYFNNCKEKTFNSMFDAMKYVNEYGIGKKVRFETSKEYKLC